MRPEAAALLWNAREAAERIARFTTGRGLDDYLADDLLRAAVERQFEIIGEACGATGTVGNATRFLEDGTVEIHRFCARCWPEQSARYQARWDEEDRLEMEAWLRGSAGRPPSRGSAFEAATWHGTLEMLREIRRALQPAEPPSAEQLAGLADEIAARAPGLEGPMPWEVERFIREYGSHAE
jgi:hypothetical protein